MLIVVRRLLLLATLIGIGQSSRPPVEGVPYRCALRIAPHPHEHPTVDETAHPASARASSAIAPTMYRECDEPCSSLPSCHSHIGCCASVCLAPGHESQAMPPGQDRMAAFVPTPRCPSRGAPRPPPPREWSPLAVSPASSAFREAAILG